MENMGTATNKIISMNIHTSKNALKDCEQYRNLHIDRRKSNICNIEMISIGCAVPERKKLTAFEIYRQKLKKSVVFVERFHFGFPKSFIFIHISFVFQWRRRDRERENTIKSKQAVE